MEAPPEGTFVAQDVVPQMTYFEPGAAEDLSDVEDAQMMCPAGHRLEGFVAQDTGWKCGMCKTQLGVGEQALGCKSCEWAVCLRCAREAIREQALGCKSCEWAVC